MCISNVAEMVMNALKEIILWRIKLVSKINAVKSEDQKKIRDLAYVL